LPLVRPRRADRKPQMQSSTRQNRDEAAYAAVLAELKNGVRDEPLMAKAFAEAEGDDNKARALYLRWRSAKLLDLQERERRQAFSESAGPSRWRTPARRPRRSWSHPRSYDFLLVIALLIGLFYFSRDFHNAVLHLAHGAGWGAGSGLR
jgi:hypothetical protein